MNNTTSAFQLLQDIYNNNFNCQPPVHREFKEVTAGEKITRILCEGKYIASREKTQHDISLYFIEDTYAEVWYPKSGYVLEKIEIIDQVKPAELYGCCFINKCES